ncbi:MAG TPA: hypothetical protein VK747_12745, partial [Blastocatellia bacterium]|nr:hypothetical protein [Blastocatellia bacterium]
ILIAREEGRTAKGVKEADDLVVVIHPKPSDSSTDAPKMNAPAIKLPTLLDVHVLVENNHAARRRFSVLATNA